MSKRLIVSGNNLAIKFPLTFTLVLYLCMDKWNAPEWLWGVVIALMIIIWLLIASLQNDQRKIDIFEGHHSEEPEKVKKSFKEKLAAKMANADNTTS